MTIKIIKALWATFVRFTKQKKNTPNHHVKNSKTNLGDSGTEHPRLHFNFLFFSNRFLFHEQKYIYIFIENTIFTEKVKY